MLMKGEHSHWVNCVYYKLIIVITYMVISDESDPDLTGKCKGKLDHKFWGVSFFKILIIRGPVAQYDTALSFLLLGVTE